MKAFIRLSRKYSEDLWMFIGFFAIMVAAARIDATLAWFVFGIECLIMAYLLAKSKVTK